MHCDCPVYCTLSAIGDAELGFERFSVVWFRFPSFFGARLRALSSPRVMKVEFK